MNFVKYPLVVSPLVAALLMLTACHSETSGQAAAPVEQAAATAPPAESTIAHDRHSYANVEDFVTDHLVLDLSVDFAARQLSGVAELDLQRRNAAARELVLDTRALSIEAAETAAADGPWTATSFKLDPENALLGSALHVDMPEGSTRVRIRYKTSPDASGLQWLDPEQTADKRQPFLFTQSQAIHARSWVPVQDTPGVRITYEATVHTPPEVVAVMSAENHPEAPRNGEYRFRMEQRIPSYLLALAVGDLAFKSTGPRTGVYAEPSVVEADAREFEDTEKMIEAAESLYGPYRWGRYDLLVLPPSFPYGGMENPRLTFATPTVVVGDKSLVALVAHELAHSWSGNLVTNATWRDFWLNESTTSYFTIRIMEAVYGADRADMERVLELREMMDGMPTLDPSLKPLAGDASKIDPDDIPSVIAYNRGSLFLYNLEKTYGRDKFDAFLKSWFDEHAFTSQTTEVFVDFLEKRLVTPNPGVMSMDTIRAWIYQPELPANIVVPESKAFAEVDAVREQWLAGQRPAAQVQAADWTVQHWTYFLEQLPGTVSAAQLADLDGAYHFSDSHNAVLMRAWLPLAIDAKYPPAIATAQRHLSSVGRMYLILPVYKALLKTPEGRAEAERIYAQAGPGYHPIARAAVQRAFKAAGG